MFGKLLGKVISAPIHILNTPAKVISTVINEKAEDNLLDKISDSIKEQLEKIDE